MKSRLHPIAQTVVFRGCLAGAAFLLVTSTARADGTEGDWFILGGSSGCWTSNVDHPAARKLAERSLKGRPLASVAFTFTDEWVALIGGTEFYYGHDLPVCRKLEEWWKDPDVQSFQCVAFTPQGGWVAIANDNTIASDNIPTAVARKLEELTRDKTPIRAVAFPPQGGWVILGESGVWHEGLPEAAGRKLDELAQGKTRVLCTAFDSRGNWVILAAGNGVWCNNTELPVFKQLLELKRQQVALRWVAFSPGEFTGDYAIRRDPTDRVTARLDMNLGRVGGKVDQWTVYGPVAPDFGGQDRMKTKLSPGGKHTEELSSLKRPVLVAQVHNAPHALHARLTVEGDLYARKLIPRPAGAEPVPDLDEKERQRYTRATDHINFEGKEFQEWLDYHTLRRQPSERDIAFARRTFSFIRDHFGYIYPPGDEHVTSVIARQKSDCGGLSMTMIAILRANGVPARLLQGRWAISSDASARYSFRVPGQCHVKAEFFAKGIGWVPFDMSAAVSDRDNGEYGHFGNDPGDFVTLFIDPDYEVDSHVNGRIRGLSLQTLLWFWKGESAGRFGLDEKWTVTKEPVKK